MHKWRCAMALMMLLALAACATRQAPRDSLETEIQAGRLGVMTDQGQSLLGEKPPPPGEETDAATRIRIAGALRLAVFDLARLKIKACPDGQLEPALCREDFAPDWALRQDKAPPGWPELERRIDAASGAIMPVWSALCEKARASAGPDDEICPME